MQLLRICGKTNYASNPRRVYLLIIFLTLIIGCNWLTAPEPDEITDEIAYRVGEALYVMDLSTNLTRKVTEPVWGNLRWSPDGERIAYEGPDGYIEAWQTLVINADGTDKRVATLWEIHGKIETHLDGGQGPVWSPDGSRIAFWRCINCEVGGLNSEIFIVDLDTTDGIKETRLTFNIYPDRISDWSPDGQRILFYSNYSLDSTFDRYGDWYAMNLDGTDKQRIMTNDSTIWCKRTKIFTGRPAHRIRGKFGDLYHKC